MLNMGFFIIFFFIIFGTFFIPKNIFKIQLMKKEQYFELFFASLLLIFFFGYFQMLISGRSNEDYLSTSFKFAIFLLLWYFITKILVNMIHKDQNII